MSNAWLVTFVAIAALALGCGAIDDSTETLPQALKEFTSDISNLWDAREALQLEEVRAPHELLGEGRSSRKHKVSDSTLGAFPGEEDKGKKADALRRLRDEEARNAASNPEVKWEDVELGEGQSSDECIDDPAWQADCEHITEHCGTSIVMKAKCRKTCGCGPKVSIYIPSLNTGEMLE